MSASRHQFKSSYGAFTAQQRELQRARALRDARDAAAQADADDAGVAGASGPASRADGRRPGGAAGA